MSKNKVINGFIHELSLKFVVHKNKKPKKINAILIGNLNVFKNW
jgi:hypothetical protein